MACVPLGKTTKCNELGLARFERQTKFLKNQKGLIFFWKITGYDGGHRHIDLIESSNGTQLCNSHCYFNCTEVWFWALN